MKIKNEDYQLLRITITTKFNEYLNADGFNDHVINHSEERVGWDMLRIAGLTQFTCDTLYKYLNDTHITTALTKIIRELKIAHKIN